jgi:sterol desaturase/sphingolipid hydroxylase (fatty acid hydroxylase superfamily)
MQKGSFLLQQKQGTTSVEILLSMSIKMGMIILIGVPAYSVLVFEILLNGTSMFNHSNIYISPKIDKIIRFLVVTPDMHRVHHSVIIRETNSNFGFNFPWWDRIFRTYKDQPDKGHTNMNIGLANFRDAKRLTLPYILALPLLGAKR